MTKRIVIIEDDQNILELLIFLFEGEGYHVSPFSKSQTAVDISLLFPDVIILDVSLIGSLKHGDAVCTELKELLVTSKLPVLLLSAEKNLQSIAEGCLADAYIKKPFDIDELLNKVKVLAA
jgi:two-component system response regulator VicR